MKMDFRFIIGLLISIVLYYTIGGIVFTSLYFIMISMFVLGVAYITVFSGKVSGKLIYMKDRYEVFETGKLNLQIYNDSRLFLSYVTAINKYTEIETRSVSARNRAQIMFHFYFPKRGTYEFQNLSLEIRDFFNIFTVRKNLRNESVRVYPKSRVLPETLFELGVGSEGIKQSRSNLEDPHMIREMRRYNVGDSLKRINWKVSAKYGELYVRRGEQNKGIDYLLVIDMCEEIYRLDQDGAKEEALVAEALAVSALLLKEGKEHKVVINGLERKEFDLRRMSQHETLVEYMVDHDSNGKKPMQDFMNEKTDLFQSASSIILFTGNRNPLLTKVVLKLKDKYNAITWFAVEDDLKKDADYEGITLKYIGE